MKLWVTTPWSSFTLTPTLLRCACAWALPRACRPRSAGPASQSRLWTCTWSPRELVLELVWWCRRQGVTDFSQEDAVSERLTCRCHSGSQWDRSTWPGRWAHVGSGWRGQNLSLLSVAGPGSFPGRKTLILIHIKHWILFNNDVWLHHTFWN